MYRQHQMLSMLMQVEITEFLYKIRLLQQIKLLQCHNKILAKKISSISTRVITTSAILMTPCLLALNRSPIKFNLFKHQLIKLGKVPQNKRRVAFRQSHKILHRLNWQIWFLLKIIKNIRTKWIWLKMKLYFHRILRYSLKA